MLAEVRVHMASPREAEIAAKAMSVGKKPGVKSVASASANGNDLVITASAEDVGSLRAVLNSSLREAKIASDCML